MGSVGSGKEFPNFEQFSSHFSYRIILYNCYKIHICTHCDKYYKCETSYKTNCYFAINWSSNTLLLWVVKYQYIFWCGLRSVWVSSVRLGSFGNERPKKSDRLVSAMSKVSRSLYIMWSIVTTENRWNRIRQSLEVIRMFIRRNLCLN